MENHKNLIGGILLGGLVGVVTGLLIAPQSGAKTRKKILKSTNNLKGDVVDTVTDSIDSLREYFNERVDRLARQAKATSNEASKAVTKKVKSV